ncbi:hypothetical protein ACHAWF_017952, partial [Thalassiosira exigua]
HPLGFALSAATADGALLIENDASGRSVLRACLLGVQADAAASVTLMNSSSLRRQIFALPNRAVNDGKRGGRGSPWDALSSLESCSPILPRCSPCWNLLLRDAIQHAWDSYADACLRPSNPTSKLLGSHILCNDLSPLSDAGHDWLYHTATVHDALDILVLAFGPSSPEFEYSLRVEGGLLGAFSFTGDMRPFASNLTSLSRPYAVPAPPRGGGLAGTLYRLKARLYDRGRDALTREHRINSRERGASLWSSASSRRSRGRSTGGTIPSGWDVMTRDQGAPVCPRSGRSEEVARAARKMTELYCTTVDDALRSKDGRDLARVDGEPATAYLIDCGRYHQLLCFLLGLVTLCGDWRYLLRHIESLFVLYCVTTDNLEERYRTERGYAGLKDMYDTEGGGHVDAMPSYFLAETLKYSLLLFGPDDYVSLGDFVFTTEVRPPAERLAREKAIRDAELRELEERKQTFEEESGEMRMRAVDGHEAESFAYGYDADGGAELSWVNRCLEFVMAMARTSINVATRQNHAAVGTE